MIVRVFINTGSIAIDKPFDYEVPEDIADKIALGVRVKVPFGAGNTPKEAYVVAVEEQSSFDKLKEVISVSDDFPVLSERAVSLCYYMRRRYFCTFAEAARVMIPPGSNTKFEEWINLSHGYKDAVSGISSVKQQQILRFLEINDGSAEFSQIKKAFGKSVRVVINALIKKGICEKSYRGTRKVNEKYVRVAYYCGLENPFTVADRIEKRSRAQAEVIRFLAGGTRFSVPDIINGAHVTRNAVESLYIKGLVDYEEAEVLRNPIEGERDISLPPHLTAEQSMAVRAIGKNFYKTYLLHGVTGSGKTEVFMNLVQNAVNDGKQAIVLVPEISLTPQMTDRFYGRFGNAVAVLHSALSMGERMDEWKRIKRMEASVVIGARSAIFAPCSNVGIIIIDEEHEESYKSEASPKYHAREIARFIAEKEKCPVVLASATPSIESYYNAMCGKYQLIEMKNRYNNNPLPKVYIADMRKELLEGNRTVLSRKLAYEMKKNMDNGESTILLLNRRGYSTFVSCRDCGFVFMCPSCSVSLTYHKQGEFLTCHYCGHSERVKSACPKCGSSRLKDFGKGTQKAQSQISEIFPDASIIRMDMDTTSGKRGHEKLLSKFEEEKTDILLGTQMVAKGLDYASVTLVGVLAADASLNIDDFRAQERTFNLITQVCGRAGRGDKAGRAVIQTYMPDNKTLNLAAKQDYKSFYMEEAEYRKAFMYPPFCDIISILVSSADEKEAVSIAERIALNLKTALRNRKYKMYGPSKAPIYKIQERYRMRIWIKCMADDEMTDIMRDVVYKRYGRANSDVSVSADVNPYNMN